MLKINFFILVCLGLKIPANPGRGSKGTLLLDSKGYFNGPFGRYQKIARIRPKDIRIEVKLILWIP
jgi:hypothetical protein